jgi:hypothetical protein
MANLTSIGVTLGIPTSGTGMVSTIDELIAVGLPISSALPAGTNTIGAVSQPTGTTTQAKVTIATTNTYQQALASNTSRKGATIQYIGVAGAIGYVYFGSAPADTTTSFQLSPGQILSANFGGVIATDTIQVTGTGTDIFIVASQ